MHLDKHSHLNSPGPLLSGPAHSVSQVLSVKCRRDICDTKGVMEEQRAENRSQSLPLCICLSVLFVGAEMLLVHSRCLSLTCCSPTSINRSLSVLQHLGAIVLLHFTPPQLFTLPLLSLCLLPNTIFACSTLIKTHLTHFRYMCRCLAALALFYFNK